MIDPRAAGEGAAAIIVAIAMLWMRYRLTSGTVDTSDAKGLWHEAALIRQDLRAAEASARRDAADCAAKSADCAAKNLVLHQEIHDLRGHMMAANMSIDVLTKDHSQCQDDVRELLGRVATLERQ